MGRPAQPLLSLFDSLDRKGNLTRLRADLAFDLGRDRRVLPEEVLGRLAALTETGLAVGEPGTGLVDDAHRDADVEEAAFLGDAFAVHHVELGDPVRRLDLVLHVLDPDAVADP